jgi:hypothetical protein
LLAFELEIQCLPRESLLRSRQSPVSMGFGTRLPGTEFTLLARLGAAGGAAHCQCLFLSDFHGYTMRVYSAASWSVLSSLFKQYLLRFTKTDSLKFEQDCCHSQIFHSAIFNPMCHRYIPVRPFRLPILVPEMLLIKQDLVWMKCCRRTALR